MTFALALTAAGSFLMTAAALAAANMEYLRHPYFCVNGPWLNIGLASINLCAVSGSLAWATARRSARKKPKERPQCPG